MRYEFRVRIEPEPLTSRVSVPARVRAGGFEISFEGALVVRWEGTERQALERVRGAERVALRFARLFTGCTGIPAGIGGRTLIRVRGDRPVRTTYYPGNRWAAREYDVSGPPPVEEIAWALLSLEFARAPAVARLVRHYDRAVRQEAPAQEAAHLLAFGRGLVAGFGDRLGILLEEAGHGRQALDALLAALERTARATAGTVAADPWDDGLLRARLAIRSFFLALPRWAPRLAAQSSGASGGAVSSSTS